MIASEPGSRISSIQPDALLSSSSATSIESDSVIDEAEDGKRRSILVQAVIDEVLPPHGFRQIHFAKLIEWEGGDSGEFVRLCAGISGYAPVAHNQTAPLVKLGEGLFIREVADDTETPQAAERERSSTYAGQLAALPQISLIAQPARVVWKPVQTGLSIDVTNMEPWIMAGVRLILKEILWWNEEVGAFVESRDAHGSLGFALHGTGQLFSGAAAMFTFIHWSSGDSVIRINGVSPTSGAPPKLRLTQRGRWRVSLQLSWEGGAHQQSLQFFWDGQNMPTPLLEDSTQNAQADSRSSSVARPAKPEQWLDLERRFKDINNATLRASLWTDAETRRETVAGRWRIKGCEARLHSHR